MADDMLQLRAELAELRRVVHGMGRMGRVKKVEKGRILVTYGKGDGGDEGGETTGTWIRTAHGGAESSGAMYAEGETVSVWAAGGNAEHAIVHKAGWNDKHPRDKNDTDTNSTRRWRKPPEKKQDQKQQGQGGGKSDSYEGKDQNEAPEWKDHDDDHQQVNDNKTRSHKMGKYSYEATKDGGVQKYDKMWSKVSKDGVVIGTGDDAHFIYKDGKIQVKCDISDKAGRKFAVQGTMTNDGKVLTSKFANE